MKKILILVGNPNLNFYDKNSAVGASLLSLKEMLNNENLKVLISNENKEIGTYNNSKKGFGKTIKNILKKYFKFFIINFSDYLYFKKQKQFSNSILSNSKFSKIDYVLEFLTYGSDIGYKLKKKYNVPLILIYDSPLSEQFKENKGINSFFKKKVNKNERKSIENADYIICYSNPVKEYLKTKNTITAKKIFIFPTINWNKLEYKETETSHNYINIGFIGSFLKWHKVDILVKAFEFINNKYKNTRLYLIGYGQEWKNIEEYIKTCSAKNNIILPGFVSGKELKKYKNILDIGVMPGSNWYGGPLKIFEYAYLKIPVIAPQTPTINDIFKKDDEILYIDEKNELNSLIEHLELLINSKAKRKELGESLFLKVKTDLSKEKQLEIYNEILK